MGIMEVMESRKSTRAFLDKKVEKEIVEKILKTAIKAPSAINLQPWEFIVVAGEERKRLSKILLKSYKEKNISCSADTTNKLPNNIYKRQKQAFETMNPYIEKIGFTFKKFINEGSCEFYSAPIAIIVTIYKAFSKTNYLSIGTMLSYFILSAESYKLGTCPIGLICAYEEEVKEFLNIPDNKNIAIGIALGYPDLNSPVNKIKTSRCDIEDIVRWIY